MTLNHVEGRTVASVDTSLYILETLRRLEEAPLAELAEEIDLSKGALHTHLTTLRKHGFVEHRGDTYALGRRFLTFGEHVRNSVPLYRAAKGEVDELAAETEECVHLITEENGQESVLYETFGDRAVGREFFLQNRSKMGRYLHYSAAGKSILSQLDESEVDAIVDEHGLPESTQYTITDREELKRELQLTRDRGYATNNEEDLPGVRAVGAPVLGPEGDVLGSLSVSAPTRRLQDERFSTRFPSLIKEYVNIIEVNLQTGDVSV